MENNQEKKKKPFLNGLEETMMGIAVGISTLLTLASVFIQFFLSPETIAAVQQMSYYSYAWVVSFALSVCARDNLYLRVPLLEQHLPDAGRKFLGVIQNLVSVIVLAVLLAIYIQATMDTIAAGKMDEKAPFLSLSLVYISLAVGFTVVNIRNIARLVKEGCAPTRLREWHFLS